MTKQIAYLQDTSDRACGSDTSVFECSRACESTLDGQISAIEWVSKKYLGSCKNYNFRFTNVFEEMRTNINVPKSGIKWSLMLQQKLNLLTKLPQLGHCLLVRPHVRTLIWKRSTTNSRGGRLSTTLTPRAV